VKIRTYRCSLQPEKPLLRRPVKKAQELGGVRLLVLSLFRMRSAQGDFVEGRGRRNLEECFPIGLRAPPFSNRDGHPRKKTIV
jgi:hypothetical protein